MKKLNSRLNLSMEDDILFDPLFSPQKLKVIQSYIQSLPSDFDIYYLGCVPYIGIPKSFELDLFQCKAVQTHCFIQSRKCMEKLYSTPFVPRHCTYFSYLDIGSYIWCIRS